MIKGEISDALRTTNNNLQSIKTVSKRFATGRMPTSGTQWYYKTGGAAKLVISGPPEFVLTVCRPEKHNNRGGQNKETNKVHCWNCYHISPCVQNKATQTFFAVRPPCATSEGQPGAAASCSLAEQRVSCHKGPNFSSH